MKMSCTYKVKCFLSMQAALTLTNTLLFSKHVQTGSRQVALQHKSIGILVLSIPRLIQSMTSRQSCLLNWKWCCCLGFLDPGFRKEMTATEYWNHACVIACSLGATAQTYGWHWRVFWGGRRLLLSHLKKFLSHADHMDLRILSHQAYKFWAWIYSNCSIRVHVVGCEQQQCDVYEQMNIIRWLMLTPKARRTMLTLSSRLNDKYRQ